MRVFDPRICQSLAILVSANVGQSRSEHDQTAICRHPPIRRSLPHEATQETEDRIGLDKGKRRDVQRRLTGLGFDTKVNGQVRQRRPAPSSRAGKAARGYPKTGFLDTLQHQALLSESVSTARASLGSGDKSDDDRPARRRGGGHHRSSGGPGGLIGGVVGGLFGRR